MMTVVAAADSVGGCWTTLGWHWDGWAPSGVGVVDVSRTWGACEDHLLIYIDVGVDLPIEGTTFSYFSNIF